MSDAIETKKEKQKNSKPKWLKSIDYKVQTKKHTANIKGIIGIQFLLKMNGNEYDWKGTNYVKMIKSCKKGKRFSLVVVNPTNRLQLMYQIWT